MKQGPQTLTRIDTLLQLDPLVPLLVHTHTSIPDQRQVSAHAVIGCDSSLRDRNIFQWGRYLRMQIQKDSK